MNVRVVVEKRTSVGTAANVMNTGATTGNDRIEINMRFGVSWFLSSRTVVAVAMGTVSLFSDLVNKKNRSCNRNSQESAVNLVPSLKLWLQRLQR